MNNRDDVLWPAEFLLSNETLQPTFQLAWVCQQCGSLEGMLPNRPLRDDKDGFTSSEAQYEKARTKKPWEPQKAFRCLKFPLFEYNWLKIALEILLSLWSFFLFLASFSYLKVCFLLLVSSDLTDYHWMTMYKGACLKLNRIQRTKEFWKSFYETLECSSSQSSCSQFFSLGSSLRDGKCCTTEETLSLFSYVVGSLLAQQFTSPKRCKR